MIEILEIRKGINKERVDKISKTYIRECLSYHDFLNGITGQNVIPNLNSEEVAEICYLIDKALDDFMISNNEANGMSMTDYKTIRLDYNEYLDKWENNKEHWNMVSVGYLKRKDAKLKGDK